MRIDYGRFSIAGEGTNADIDTSEEDVVVITDINQLDKSQATIFIDYDLGTNTSLKVRYYIRNEVGGSWYQIPLKNETSGVLVNSPSIIDSTSPASRVIEQLPIPACFAFKVTAQGAGGANSSVTAKVLVRNN